MELEQLQAYGASRGFDEDIEVYDVEFLICGIFHSHSIYCEFSYPPSLLVAKTKFHHTLLV